VNATIVRRTVDRKTIAAVRPAHVAGMNVARGIRFVEVPGFPEPRYSLAAVFMRSGVRQRADDYRLPARAGVEGRD
jgi:hypothetical protein